MAYLLLRSSHPPRGGLLSGRVLIGRWNVHPIFVDDQTVSRIHAWITLEGDRYFITDGGSFNGTTVNGHRVGTRHLLRNGDIIAIGPETLSYHDGSRLPAEVEPIDLSPRPIANLRLRSGFFVDCPCGAPLPVKDGLRGRQGRCRFCGRTHLLIPASQQEEIEARLDFDEGASGGNGAKSARKICSVCQGQIVIHEAITRCPSCGLAFHSECWTENRGCSAYGCPQVGALDPVLPDAQ